MGRRDTLKIRELARQAFRECAQEAFNRSQERCPVISGKLKRSGSLFMSGDMATIHYSAPYASFVEKGWKGSIVTVPSSTRSRSYSYLRRAKKGTHFIENSTRAAFSHFQEKLSRLASFRG
jgi:hypothetical protein